MKKTDDDLEMRDEYDFSKGVRGRCAERFANGTNIVVLDDDVASEFASSDEVNDVLRRHIAQRREKAASGA